MGWSRLRWRGDGDCDGGDDEHAEQDRQATMADLQADIGRLEVRLLESMRRLVVLRQGPPPGLTLPRISEAMVPARVA